MSSPTVAGAPAGSWAAPAAIAAPVVYAAAVIIGGAVTPGYSHLANMISELTLASAPNRTFLATLFVVYNLLAIAFALLLPGGVADGGRRRMIGIGRALLVIIALAGIGMVTAFPTDRPTDPLTATGWVHVGLAALASLGTMAAVLAFALAFRGAPGWRRFSTVSFVCLAGIFASGLWTAATAAQLSPLMGLAERLTIGICMVWLFAFGLTLTRHRRGIHAL